LNEAKAHKNITASHFRRQSIHTTRPEIAMGANANPNLAPAVQPYSRGRGFPFMPHVSLCGLEGFEQVD